MAKFTYGLPAGIFDTRIFYRFDGEVDPKVRIMKKLLTVADRPFFASEVGLCGSEMYSLCNRHWVRPTGRTEERETEIFGWGFVDGSYCYHSLGMKKYTAKEWEITDPERLKKVVPLVCALDELLMG